jgi:predicted nucleic acid-binding protein
VVLARNLNTRLVTADRKLLRQFPDEAISIEDFAEGK